MINRRNLLIFTGSTLALPLVATPNERTATSTALTNSSLVYITPLTSSARESRCQAEVWFAYDGADVFVVSAADTWRARAVGRGLIQARIWVGEFGNWKRSNGQYREAPTFTATAAITNDPVVVKKALGLFGDKYTAEWGTWGPRFENGLADGSRVLLRYSPA